MKTGRHKERYIYDLIWKLWLYSKPIDIFENGVPIEWHVEFKRFYYEVKDIIKKYNDGNY